MWILTTNLETVMEQIYGLPPYEEVHLPHKSRGNIEFYNMPYFSYIFDELCNLLGRLPTQECYASYYLSRAIANNCYEIELYLRAKRNYSSFLREYHLYLLLKEKLPFKIYFNRLLDCFGFDFVIQVKQLRYGIRSFINSPFSYCNYSRKYCNDKTIIYQKFFNIIDVIDLPIDKNNAIIINGYWLYDWENVKKILVGRRIYDSRRNKKISS